MEDAGFAGAAQGMRNISADNKWMSEQISAGHLRINPEAAAGLTVLPTIKTPRTSRGA